MNKHLYIKFILSGNVNEELFITNLRSWLANANDQLGPKAIVFYMPVAEGTVEFSEATFRSGYDYGLDDGLAAKERNPKLAWEKWNSPRGR